MSSAGAPFASWGADRLLTTCGLLHDIGDTIGAHNPPDIAGAILKPFVSLKNHYVVRPAVVRQGIPDDGP